METLRQRVTLPFWATVVGAALGAVMGCLVGRAIIFHQASTRLDRDSARLIAAGDVRTAESRSVLAGMNSSHLPTCSDADITAVREMVFHSQFLKEAGRMYGDSIACSTTLGRVHQTIQPVHPNYLQRDGSAIYMNLAPFRLPQKTTIAVRLGDSFVVYNPYNLQTETPHWMHFTVTDMDRISRHAGRIAGEEPPTSGVELLHEGKARFNDSLYATHCSKDGVICLSAYTTVVEALGANKLEFAGFVVSCTFAGGLFGLVCPILYRKNKGIEKQLLRAIRQDALRVVYQPIVELASGRIVGAEALVRWNDDDNLAVPPDVFVRIAEERGCVGKITRLVVRHTLRDFGKVLRERPDFHVNVNIAAPDLADPDFVPMIERVLAQAGVPAKSLGIEITESHTARQQVAKDTILRLRQKGHVVHIDDFGTGFSSLAYLYDLSVDAIKIDRAFVRAIGTEAVTVTILPQIMSMARQLNLRVVVEGIETPEQAAYFAGSAQDILAQGWLFGRPVPAEEFLRRLGTVPANEVFRDAPALEEAIPV